MGVPATQWVSVYNARQPMKQRYVILRNHPFVFQCTMPKWHSYIIESTFCEYVPLLTSCLCCIRYHYNVADARLAQHIERGNADGLLISSVASCSNLWALIMDAGTGFTSQVYELSPFFLHKVDIRKVFSNIVYCNKIQNFGLIIYY